MVCEEISEVSNELLDNLGFVWDVFGVDLFFQRLGWRDCFCFRFKETRKEPPDSSNVIDNSFGIFGRFLYFLDFDFTFRKGFTTIGNPIVGKL